MISLDRLFINPEAIIATAFVGIVFLICERLLKFSHIDKSIQRKILHITLALAVITVSFFIQLSDFLFVGLSFAVGAILSRSCNLFPNLSDRRNESYGELFFSIGIILASIISINQKSFVVAMLVLGFADTLAAIVGQRIKSPKIIFNKSVAGSTTCLLATCFILFVFGYSPLLLIIGILVTLAEMFSPLGIDNAIIPFLVALLLRFFN